MEKYAYITNPYNGMSISTKSIQGRKIVSEYNHLKGGAAIAGTVGAVLVVGGLFAYTLFFNVGETKDTEQKKDQNILLFTSKVIADPNSSNKDIESSLQQCTTLISYYDTSIQKINENIRNIQYSSSKDTEENKKKIEMYNKQIQYFTDKKKVIESNKKKLEDLKKIRTTLEFNYWYEDQYVKLYDLIKESIVEQKYKTKEEWREIADTLDVLYSKEKEEERKRRKEGQRKRREREKYYRARGIPLWQIKNLTDAEEKNLLLGNIQSPRGYNYPSNYTGMFPQMIPPVRKPSLTQQRSSENVLYDTLNKKKNRKSVLFMTNTASGYKRTNRASETELILATTNIFIDLIKMTTNNERDIYDILDRHTHVKGIGNYYNGSVRDWQRKDKLSKTPKDIIDLLSNFVNQINPNDKSRNKSTLTVSVVNDMVSATISPIFMQQGGAERIDSSKKAFDEKILQEMPTKIIEIRKNLYKRIKERYINIAEKVFKKHFINRKTAIKEEELFTILQPIIREKNKLQIKQ